MTINDDMKFALLKIQHKAEYISDIALSMQAGMLIEEPPLSFLQAFLDDLTAMSEALDEYHEWENE